MEKGVSKGRIKVKEMEGADAAVGEDGPGFKALFLEV